jgi:(1->4)-alpha-D-glucan 1-alpha-D-glucosylmutase
MLSTSTHDTKRGEDVRARLAVLSELASEWEQQVNAWSRILRARRGDLNASAPPSRNDEYFFYQLLVGSWPAELSNGSKNGKEVASPGTVNGCVLEKYKQRVQAAMRKAIREERTNSNWISPNEEYEAAVASFINDALDPQRSETFLSVFRAFEKRVAEYGVQNSLVQLVLKLTSPGVPDIYQGADGWELSLGDPDSRRPVDYAARAEQLHTIRARLPSDRVAVLEDFVRNWHDGSIKMAILMLLLDERKSKPQLFSDSSYEPITVTGACSTQVCAFLRKYEGASLFVAVKLFPATNPGVEAWEETLISAPANWSVGRDLLTNRLLGSTNETYSAPQLFAVLPVAVLVQPS